MRARAATRCRARVVREAHARHRSLGRAVPRPGWCARWRRSATRALGCAHGEREVAALAARSGLDAAELESIVTHLGSPALGPIDAALVPFARVTARARPVQLQQRARALRETLSPEEVVEAVGLCALANALYRLGVAAELA